MMAITWLLYGLAGAALLQPNAPRFFAAGLFVAITLLHEAIFSDLTGLYYYFSAALFDSAILILISGIRPVPKMVLDLQQICMASILANFLGWALWFYRFEPTAYDTAYIFIYGWALLTILKKDSSDVGGYTVDSWRSCLRFGRGARGVYSLKYGGPL